MTNRTSVLAVAAVVYDQENHSPSDLAFLDAINKAGRDWSDSLNHANKMFGANSPVWNAVKRIATRQRDAEYSRALAALEAHDDDELEFAEAAE